METVAFLLVAGLVAVWGMASVLWPHAVMGFRKRWKGHDTYWFGGYFYSNALRTRLTGSALLLIGFFALFGAIT